MKNSIFRKFKVHKKKRKNSKYRDKQKLKVIEAIFNKLLTSKCKEQDLYYNYILTYLEDTIFVYKQKYQLYFHRSLNKCYKKKRKIFRELTRLSKPCLRNRTTLRFDFLHSFMVCAQTYAYLVQG